MICTTLLLAIAPTAFQEPRPAPSDQAPAGLLRRTEQAQAGYTLLAPLRSTDTFLIDDQGEVVHTWSSEYTPGHAADLLPNGDLVRAAKSGDNQRYRGGGEGGLLEQFNWSGERVWSHRLSSEDLLQHHDFDVLPNGNLLTIVWEGKSRDEAVAAGRRADSVGETGLWPDAILELRPTQPEGAEIVWEWHAWDHLVQDTDPNLPHYGDPAEHPGRLDVNIGAQDLGQPETDAEKAERLALEDRLRSLGYVGGSAPAKDNSPAQDRGREGGSADWMHTNSVSYDAELDLIVISARNFSEILVIDHSTTIEQAAGSEGGRHGRGGDLLWRWGNSKNYGRGDAAKRTLFGQHDARWTRSDSAVAVTVFNNGQGRADGDYSSVDRIELPLQEGVFTLPDAGSAHLPQRASWTYSAPNKQDFYSSHISGAMPLSDGRMLICEGESGRVFQVDAQGEILWEYRSPFESGAGQAGGPPRGGRGGPGGREGGPGRESRPGDGEPGARPEGPPAGGPPEGGPPEGRGPGSRPERGGPRRAGGGGGPSGGSLFRAVHVPENHPGLPFDSE